MQQDSSTSKGVIDTWAPDLAWIDRVCDLLAKDEAYLSKSRYFRASILLVVGSAEFSIDTWHGRTVWTQVGRQISGYDFAITAPADVWESLVAAGEDFGKTLTGYGSAFTIENNQALAASNWAAVWHLINALVRGAQGGLR